MMKRTFLSVFILLSFALGAVVWAQPKPTIQPNIPKIPKLSGPKQNAPLVTKKGRRALEKLGKARKLTAKKGDNKKADKKKPTKKG